MPSCFKKAIVVGDACLDVSFKLEDYLTNDEKEMPYSTSVGGTSAGTIVPLSKLGIETAFLGTLGDDFAGRFLLNGLEDLGIDTTLVKVKKELNTVNVFGLIDEKGERHLWGFPRVNTSTSDISITKEDKEKITTASWIHGSGMSLLYGGNILENLPKIFELAYKANIPTSFDLNTRVSDISLLNPQAVEAIKKILPYTNYLFGSAKDELVSFYPCDDYKVSARSFVSDKRVVIARMAEEGTLVINNKEERIVNSYKIDVVNSTGAGDTFNAGFIASKLNGLDDFEACQYASACAAYKISRNDGQKTICKENIEKFMLETALR